MVATRSKRGAAHQHPLRLRRLRCVARAGLGRGILGAAVCCCCCCCLLLLLLLLEPLLMCPASPRLRICFSTAGCAVTCCRVMTKSGRGYCVVKVATTQACSPVACRRPRARSRSCWCREESRRRSSMFGSEPWSLRGRAGGGGDRDGGGEVQRHVETGGKKENSKRQVNVQSKAADIY